MNTEVVKVLKSWNLLLIIMRTFIYNEYISDKISIQLSYFCIRREYKLYMLCIQVVFTVYTLFD